MEDLIMTQTCDHCGQEAVEVYKSGYACSYHSRTTLGPIPDTIPDEFDIQKWNNITKRDK